MRGARAWVLAVAVVLLCCCGGEKNDEPRQPAPMPQRMEVTETFSGNNAYLHCAKICALGPRPTGSAAYAAQVEYVKEQLEREGWRVKIEEFEPYPGRKMRNVHAVLGEENGTRKMLLSCHIDTKGQGNKAILGADDGASGEAVLLELGRVLARPQNARLAANVELVFFDGEESFGERITPEDGLFGSRHDVERRGESLPDMMINLDMVGGAGKTIGVPVWDTPPGMCEQYCKAVDALGLPEERWTLHFGSFWDDHRPFAEAGVETLNLIASFKGANWWHTQRDNMSRISATSLGETGALVMQLLHQLLGVDQSS